MNRLPTGVDSAIRIDSRRNVPSREISAWIRERTTTVAVSPRELLRVVSF